MTSLFIGRGVGVLVGLVVVAVKITLQRRAERRAW